MRSVKLEEIYEVLKELKPLLKDVVFTYNIEQYPEDRTFRDDQFIPPYARLSVKKSRSKKKKQMEYHMTLFSNMMNYYQEEIYKGSNADVLKLFESLDVEFNDDSLLVFNFLHELGHVLVYEEYRKEVESYDNLLTFTDLQYNALDLAFIDKPELIYKFDFHELAAEKFAYSTFPVVMKVLRHRELS
ncbi:hypothetical protein EBB07_28715 [Paenibacillaceae bacterium]|nr:hypothetical protein EBB07_28715 [Paenibacillaceae bacterium]